MRPVDWVVFSGALTYVVLIGLWRGRAANSVNKFLLGGREVPWHVVGLSIMATQASAVTFISTTGQAYVDGMRFVQFYFGLPIAMVILAWTAVPLFRKAGVYTAYEYLERRFDSRVRALVSGIFLLQRGLALGITLYAPAVVLSVMLGWPDWITTLLMGGIAVAYTATGGAKAIAWSDAQQMLVMTAGLVAAFVCAVRFLPAHVSFANAVSLAHAAGRLERDHDALRLGRPVQPVEWSHRRRVSGARVLRDRSEPGAAVSHGPIGLREPARASSQRRGQDSDAVADSVHRRHGVRLLSRMPSLRCCFSAPNWRASRSRRTRASTRRSSSDTTRRSRPAVRRPTACLPQARLEAPPRRLRTMRSCAPRRVSTRRAATPRPWRPNPAAAGRATRTTSS